MPQTCFMQLLCCVQIRVPAVETYKNMFIVCTPLTNAFAWYTVRTFMMTYQLHNHILFLAVSELEL